MRIGIIGCGVICHTYIRDIQRLYDDLTIEAVADVDTARAAEVSSKYGIAKSLSVDELLSDSSVELVVNLTPPAFHTEVNRRILRAGKHLFCEKPLALTLPEAIETVELAKEMGVQIACAPDTFMGSSLASCIRYLQDGLIGKPLYAKTNMMHDGVELWHPAPEAFYQKGGGPIYDMGGYYFTALIAMFGPVKSVRALGATGVTKRTRYAGEGAGETFDVSVPTHYEVLATFKSGAIANMTFSFEISYTEMPMFEVYGTEGTLFVPDPNMHGGTPRVYRREQTLCKLAGKDNEHGDKPYELPELYENVGEYVRGIGVHDLACAIAEHREPKANGRLAVHVVDILTSILASAESGEEVLLSTETEEV